MQNITSIAASRLIAQQRALDVAADNIANANTPGYKAVRVQFSDWLSRQTGAATPRGGAIIAFTQDRATWRDLQPGPLSHTGNPLDLAITSAGYFTVSTPQGPRLTRAGRFGLLPDGTIADAAGNALLNTTGQPIQLSAHRYKDHRRRRRHAEQRERPDRQDRRGAAGRSHAAACRRQ